MKWLARFLGKIGDYSFKVCMAAMVALVVIITATVIARYVFDYGILWSIETSGYLQLLLVFLPAMYILQQDRHIKMKLVTSRTSGKVRASLAVLSSLAGLVFSVFFAYQTYKSVIDAAEWGTRSMVAGIPLVIPWTVMMIGLILFALQFLVELAKNVGLLAARGTPGKGTIDAG